MGEGSSFTPAFPGIQPPAATFPNPSPGHPPKAHPDSDRNHCGLPPCSERRHRSGSAELPHAQRQLLVTLREPAELVERHPALDGLRLGLLLPGTFPHPAAGVAWSRIREALGWRQPGWRPAQPSSP